MIWQNETTHKTSNSSNEVTLRFIGGKNPKSFIVVFKMAKLEQFRVRISLLHEAHRRNAEIRNAAEKMCEHLGVSLAELNSVARDIRKFAAQLL